MRNLRQLKESFWPPDPKVTSGGKAVVSTVQQAYGVRTVPTFKTQVTAYNEDPLIKEAVLQFAQQVTSTGIFTTGGSEATLPKSTGGRWTAKECIDEWNRANNLDDKILTIATELNAFGNSFWHISDGFNYIPIESVEFASAPRVDRSVRDLYELRLTGIYDMRKLPQGSFIHFKANVVGTAPFGTGILYSLLITPTDGTTPSLYEIRKSIRKSMKVGFEKFSFGNSLWTFEGMTEDALDALQTKLNTMPYTGQRIATNAKGHIDLELPQRSTSYDTWIKQMEDEFFMALGNPTLKLGLEQGFTKATSESALEMFNSKIESLRREIKRQIESLWVEVLNSAGFDGMNEGIALNFGSQEVDYDTQDLFRAVELGIITIQEARTMLNDSMKWQLNVEGTNG